MRELHLFAGAGGGILGGMLLGHRCVGAVELDAYCRRVLQSRQADGTLEAFPIHDDIKTFDGKPWRGAVDVVCGGFPCQDISTAGKGAGLGGEASSLWFEMLRVVGEVAPAFVFVENVRALTRRGLGTVLGGLAEFGFDAEWCVLSAEALGAPHRRQRLWLLAAHPDLKIIRQQPGWQCGQGRAGSVQPVSTGPQGAPAHPEYVEPVDAEVAGASQPARNADRAGLEERQGQRGHPRAQLATTLGTGWWATEPDVGRVAHGVAARVDRLRALGNGQVPAVAATAFSTLMRRYSHA